MFRFFSRRQYNLVLCAALALSAIGTGGCRRKSTNEQAREVLNAEAKKAKDQLSGIKNIVLQGGSLRGGDSKGRPLWEIGADEIRIVEGNQMQPRRANLTKAWAKLFQNGKEESVFKAARMVFLDTPQGLRFSLIGDVRVLSSGALLQGTGPVSLKTPRADVNVRARRLLATGGIIMEQKTRQIVVKAQRLNASTALGVAELTGKVNMTSPQGKASADKAMWNWQTRRVQATGNVTATDGETTVSGERLQADTGASRGVLSGDVKVKASGGEASAGTVNFNWQDRTLAAREGVRLAKDGASLRAARADADADLNRATADGDVVLEKQGVTVRASHVAGYDKMTRAVASGGVTLVRADLTVNGSNVEARGIGSENTLRVTARGGVTAKNKTGSVSASTVTWGGGRVVASGGVTFSKDGNILSGDRLQSDDKFENATLAGDVHGSVSGARITAGKLTKKGAKIAATNGITARRGNLRMRAERLDAIENGNDAILTGGVEIKSDDGITIRSPQARYAGEAGKGGKVYANKGVFFQDTKRGMHQRGKTLIYDIDKRQAVLTDVVGKTNQGAMDGFKLF